MKLLFERKPLYQVLQNIASVIDRVKILPILGNVKLQVDESGMVLTTTDTELQMVAQLPMPEGEIAGGKFDTTLGAQKLLDIVSSTTAETIAIEFSDTQAVIHTDYARYNLSTLPSEGFPQLDLTNFDQSITVSKKTLKTLINKVSFAISTKDIRAPLRGMLLEAQGTQIRVVATDGHRLASAVSSLEKEIDSDCSIIIPLKAVTEIKRLLEDEKGDLTLSISDNFISFQLKRTENLTFASKLIVGSFPSYAGVIPQNNDYTFSADCDSFSKTLKQATLINKDSTRQVRLIAKEDDTATITCLNAEQEKSEVVMSASYDGEHLEIAFNEGYLQQTISTLSQPIINIKISTPTASVLIEEKDDDVHLQHVIMPMTI